MTEMAELKQELMAMDCLLHQMGFASYQVSPDYVASLAGFAP